MSQKHPIIALTGSSGAGTSQVRKTFASLFEQIGIKAAYVAGDGFHRYSRAEMDKLSLASDKDLTHFGSKANLFPELANLFEQYGQSATGTYRHYIHNEVEALQYNAPSGEFTDWQALEDDTDLLFYEGLHGGVVTENINVAKHVDLLIGIVPIINLEWVQKIHRDKEQRGHTLENTTDIILQRMHDYVHYIVPQFSLTDINFQRVPLVDTSNPFNMESIPDGTESFTVVHFRNTEKITQKPSELLTQLPGAFLSNEQTIVLPFGGFEHAIHVILQPVIEKIIRTAQQTEK